MALCDYCSEYFVETKRNRLFCSDVCRTRHNRKHHLVCYFCGDVSVNREGITKQQFESEPGEEKQVPCCFDCAGVLQTISPAKNAVEKTVELRKKIYKKHKLKNTIPEWSEDEFKDMDWVLKETINNKMKQQQQGRNRIVGIDIRIGILCRHYGMCYYCKQFRSECQCELADSI